MELIKRKARQDFESAKRGFDLALASALARDKTASLSRKLYQDNLLRFRKGLANANELALDQRRLYESELSAIKGWNSAHTQYSKLCHSVGRRIRECGQDPVSAPY